MIYMLSLCGDVILFQFPRSDISEKNAKCLCVETAGGILFGHTVTTGFSGVAYPNVHLIKR